MKIILFCCTGYSSSILMKNIQQCILQKDIHHHIEAHAICESTLAKESDVILLSPQVRFNLSKIKAMYPDIPVGLINLKDFEAANGEAIIKQIDVLQKAFYDDQKK